MNRGTRSTVPLLVLAVALAMVAVPAAVSAQDIGQALAGLATGDRLLYLAAMVAPLGGLPLLGGWDLIGALPVLAQNLLSGDPVLYNHRTQYQAFVLPFLVLAAVAGYSRLSARNRRGWPVAVLAGAAALSLALASRAANDLAVARWWPDAEQRAAYPVLARIPPAASVSAQDRYVAHVSLRERVTVFPVALEAAQYVVVNVTPIRGGACPT